MKLSVRFMVVIKEEVLGVVNLMDCLEGGGGITTITKTNKIIMKISK